MDKLLNTFFVNAKFYFRDYLLFPMLVILLLCFIKIIYSYKINSSDNKFTSYFLSKIRDKKLLLKFVFSLYLLVNLNATVFSRFRLEKIDPFANIWGGWIIEANKYYFDFSVIWNILMFLPMSVFIFLYDKYIRKKKRTYFQTALISTAVSFINSLIIESMQIIFSVGTFQVSDLVYNTLGGLLGIFILIVLIRIINLSLISSHSKSKRKNKI